MEWQRVSGLFLVLMTAGISAEGRAHQRQPASAAEQQSRAADKSSRLTGRVVQIHAPRVFTVREDGPAARETLVIAPRPLSPGFVGATVTVVGEVRRLREADLKRAIGLGEIDERTREQLIREPVLVATSVLALSQREPSPPAEEPPPPVVPTPQPRVAPAAERPVTVRATMLVANLDVFAGRQVRVLNGRVVGVLEPDAFLIEPATPYLKPMGQRDRLLVLIQSAALRVPAHLIVGSIVTVTGVPRTLVGMQVTREVAWPTRLQPDLVDRLEIRAALLVTSVQTEDGVELTGRASAAAR